MNDSDKLRKLEESVEKLRSQQQKLALLVIWSAAMVVIILFLVQLDSRSGRAIGALACLSVIGYGLWMMAGTGRQQRPQPGEDHKSTG